MLYAYAIRFASRFALRLLSCYSSNEYVCKAVAQPCTHITTEKANPFFTITNRVGGWVISKSFPLRGYGFKMYV